MIRRTHGWIARALAPALVLATAAGPVTAIGGCTDEVVDDISVGTTYLELDPANECDQDGDGYWSSENDCAGKDCDDLDRDVYPGHGCTETGAGCTSPACCEVINPDPEYCPA
jgi:hypothetical protein